MVFTLPMILIKANVDIFFLFLLVIFNISLFFIEISIVTCFEMSFLSYGNIHFSFLNLKIKRFGIFFFKLLLLFRLIESAVITKRKMSTSQVIHFFFGIFRHLALFALKLGFSHTLVVQIIGTINNIILIASGGLELGFGLDCNGFVLEVVLKTHD